MIPSFRGAPLGASRESILTIIVVWIPGSCFARPGMTKEVARRAKNSLSGKSPKTCPALSRKIFHFPRRANRRYQLAPSCTPQRGAFRDRHERWVRDAVDAAVRETGATVAYGEVVWS
jgi:hypothetical protein